MIKIWKNLHRLVKAFICLLLMILVIFVEAKFISESKIVSVAIVLNKDKGSRYKGGTDYKMCLQQINDKKVYSLDVGFTTYSLFDKGDTIVFKLNKEQVYPKTSPLKTIVGFSLMLTMIACLFLFVSAGAYIWDWAEILLKKEE